MIYKEKIQTCVKHDVSGKHRRYGFIILTILVLPADGGSLFKWWTGENVWGFFGGVTGRNLFCFKCLGAYFVIVL